VGLLNFSRVNKALAEIKIKVKRGGIHCKVNSLTPLEFFDTMPEIKRSKNE
jgi:hypothetical protein